MTTEVPPRTEAKTLRIALIGAPNTGKSTLFTALTGIHTRIGNYAGVTVEKKIGHRTWNNQRFELIDLPGTHSLAPQSADEVVSVQVLSDHQPDVGPVDAIVCVADATQVTRHLYLFSQLMELGKPMVLALNMSDELVREGITIDLEALSSRLGVPVVATNARRRRGVEELLRNVEQVIANDSRPVAPRIFPDEVEQEFSELAVAVVADIPNLSEGEARFLSRRFVLGQTPLHEMQVSQADLLKMGPHVERTKQSLEQKGYVLARLESQQRHGWSRELCADCVTRTTTKRKSRTDQIDAFVTHPILGMILFAGLMLLIFQTVYYWAGPLMDLFDAAQGSVSEVVTGVIGPGPLRSLLVDGVIAGVGGVLIFLPQILLLFLYLAILEDSGYMPRAALMADRVLGLIGLNGKSFVPLMSSFACAIPGIMATRSIASYRDRMITIMIAPLMSCSARLPVYLLLIGAFVPATSYFGGWIGLQALVLFGMTILGALVAIPVSLVLKNTYFRGETSAFILELPDYKIPSPRVVLMRMYQKGKVFVTRAGTLIFAMTIIVWAAGYFPGDHSNQIILERQIEAKQALLEETSTDSAEVESIPVELDALERELNAENARLIQTSFLGMAGRGIEPVVKPLGWDWKIGVGALASFPAREVIVATLGTIYSLGGDVDEKDEGLIGSMRAAKWPDGRPVFTVPVAFSVMVFFALCAQCGSTLAIIKRETNSWSWPIISFVYMTTLAYLGALLTYQLGQLFG